MNILIQFFLSALCLSVGSGWRRLRGEEEEMAGRGRLVIKVNHGRVDQPKVFLQGVQDLRPSTEDPCRVSPLEEVQCLQPSTRGWPSSVPQTVSLERGSTPVEGGFVLKMFSLNLTMEGRWAVVGVEGVGKIETPLGAAPLSSCRCSPN